MLQERIQAVWSEKGTSLFPNSDSLFENKEVPFSVGIADLCWFYERASPIQTITARSQRHPSFEDLSDGKR